MWLSIGRSFEMDMEKYEEKLKDAGFITDWVDTGQTREAEKEYVLNIELDSLADLLRLSRVVGHALVINDDGDNSPDIVIEDSYRY